MPVPVPVSFILCCSSHPRPTRRRHDILVGLPMPLPAWQRKFHTCVRRGFSALLCLHHHSPMNWIKQDQGKKARQDQIHSSIGTSYHAIVATAKPSTRRLYCTSFRTIGPWYLVGWEWGIRNWEKRYRVCC